MVAIMIATKRQMNISAIAAVSSLVITQYVAKPVLEVTAAPMAKRENDLRMEASMQKR